MNILFYLFFVVFGFIAISSEISRKKTSSVIFILMSVLFVMIICSRIGHDEYYNDLNSYISYFQNDDDKYFEPGYVFFVGVIKSMFGYNASAFISCVGLFELLFLLFSYLIIANNENKEVAGVKSYKNKNSYGLLSLFYIYSIYWGTSFGCEVIRLGIAISILFCSYALAITGKKVLSLVLFPLAFSFQYTSLIFIVGIFSIFFIDKIKTQHLWIVFILSILIDLSYLFGLCSFSLGDAFLSKVLSAGDIFSHYDSYSGTVETTFSLQYIAYHFFGFIMLYGMFNDNKYKGAVIIYIIGLFIGSLFNGSVFSMRLQWLFLPYVIYALFIYLKNSRSSIQRRLFVVGAYTVVEFIMAIRYLGYYV
jgi:hypothetical protein